MEEIILNLCNGDFLNLDHIADILNRSPDTFRTHYFNQMVKRDFLSCIIPINAPIRIRDIGHENNKTGNFSMLSKSEYKGKWWIPADSHNEIDGTLKINPNGTGTLEIWGELIKEDFSEFPPTSEEVEIILGRTSEGSKITLFNCQLAGTSRSSEGFPLQTVNIATNILHVHFLTKDTISFRKLMVEFKHFEHLIKSTRIQVTNSSQVAIPINNVEREEIPFFSVTVSTLRYCRCSFNDQEIPLERLQSKNCRIFDWSRN